METEQAIKLLKQGATLWCSSFHFCKLCHCDKVVVLEHDTDYGVAAKICGVYDLEHFTQTYMEWKFSKYELK